MTGKADNDNELCSARGRKSQGVIEIISTGLRGRTDLFELALSTRKEMLELREQLKQLKARIESAAPVELRLIDRELGGLVSKHKTVRERYQAIEEAMDPSARVQLWQQVDAEDNRK